MHDRTCVEIAYEATPNEVVALFVGLILDTTGTYTFSWLSSFIQQNKINSLSRTKEKKISTYDLIEKKRNSLAWNRRYTEKKKKAVEDCFRKHIQY